MAELSGPIHVAIAAALEGESPAIAGGRIYDLGNVPKVENRVFPYVVIAEYYANDADDKGAEGDDGFGDEFAQWIDVWSRDNRGKKTVEEIVSAIYALLHDRPQALGAGTMILMRCRYKTIFLDPDGLTVRGRLRFEGNAQSA